MGIFFEYGIEFGYCRVIDGSYVSVIPISAFDARLLASEYYQRHRHEYDAVRSTWVRKADNVDIVLTTAEETVVRGAILTGAEQGGVGDVGFYSVCRSGTSY
jgi:hypothetical protein